VSYTSLADGSHTFQVRAIDGAGNVDPSPASFTWTIDTAPPDTMINSGPPNPSGSSSASFNFSGTDGGTGVASFQCKLDGGSFAVCISPQSYSGLSNGSHTFQVRAIDGIGNADPTPASYTWTVDTVAPTVTINQAAGQADPTGSSPINFTAVFSEPVTGFGNSAGDVTLSGTAGATTFVVTQIAPNNGTTYNVAVSGMTASGTVTAGIPAGAANDAAGNGSAASTSTDNTVTFVLNFPPTVTVAAGGLCGGGAASGTINLTVSDANTPLSNVTLSASSSNTAVVPNANIVFGGSGANRTVTISGVSQSSIQSSIITITVNDGQGGTSTVPVTVIVGTNHGETIIGTSGADMIFGLNGGDTISAGAGNDLMCGGNAKDTLTGGSGADFFGGGNGPDSATDFNPSEGDTTDGY
jgi:Ca2+-binding RTX toxin-like protein